MRTFIQFVLKSVAPQTAVASAPIPLDASLLAKVGGGMREADAPKNGW